jgi:DNA-binding SARP family transcriptional activator
VIVTLTFRLLAQFQIGRNGEAVAPLSRRQQALVAYLALRQDKACSRRTVASALWPDTRDEQALTNLRTQISRLRQSLPEIEQIIDFGAQTLLWHAPHSAFDVALFMDSVAEAKSRRTKQPLDAITFCQLALETYVGDLLPDWYDEWLSEPREQLRAQFGEVCELLALLLEEQRRMPEAIAAAQRLIQIDPLHEPAYAQLMRIHLAEGDRNSALRVYQMCVAALRRELGAVPGPPIQYLYQQTLNQGNASGAVKPLSQQPQPPAFVGREQELRWLQDAWRRSAAGVTQLVFVAGVAGIGKTRLVEEWTARLSRQGVAIATAHCYAGGDTLAYAALTELLRSSCFQPHIQSLEAHWASEVARLLPEILDSNPHVTPPGPLTETWQRQRFFQALTRIVVGVPVGQPEESGLAEVHGTTPESEAPRPLVLLLDDLQWCDGETLDWILYLLHVAANQPLLIVATLRSEDLRADSALVRLSLALERSGQLSELVLGPLSPTDTAALAANVGGRVLNNSEARHLFRDTEGNPLFIVEIIRAWPDGTPLRQGTLPAKMQAVVHYRLAQLSTPAGAVVQTAAVIGREFGLPLLLQTGRHSEEEAIEGLDELWRRQIVRQSGQANYEFSHEQLRQVAYEGIAPEQRRFLHGHVADALAALHAADRESVAAQIAYHYAQSHQTHKALEYTLLAAGAAAQVFANREAVNLYRRAHAMLPAHDGRAIAILESLGELHRRQGEWQDAQGAYDQALALVDAQDVIRYAALLNKLGRALIASHQRASALNALSHARTLLESATIVREESWYTTWIAVLLGLMEWHYWGGSTDEMAKLQELLQGAVAQYGTRPQHLEWQQLIARLAFRRTRYSMTPAMVEERRGALELAQQFGEPQDAALAHFGYAFTLLWSGQALSAAAQLREALYRARQIGFVLLETQCLAYLSVAARLTNNLDDTRTFAVLTLESAQASQRLDYVAIAHANMAWLAWRAGDLRGARELAIAALDDWEEAATGIPFRWLALWPLIGVALQENRLELALSHATRLLEESQQPPSDSIRSHLQSALSAVRSGHMIQARAHLEAAAATAHAIRHL